MTIEELREEVRRLFVERPRVDDQPYDEEIRRAGISYVLACREQGMSWSALSAGVPVSVTTLSKWVAKETGTPTRAKCLVPVQVVESREFPLADEEGEAGGESGPVLVSPGGYRLLGLTLEQAVAAFRVMG